MNGSKFVSVYRAMDEMTANIIKGFLEDSGIPAIVHPMYASKCFDGAIAMAEGFWGDVLVPEKSVDEAKALLEEYARSQPDDENEDDHAE